MRKYTTLFFLLQLLSHNLFSQNSSTQEVSSYIQTLYDTWDSAYSNYSISHTQGDSASGVNLIANTPSTIQGVPNENSSNEELSMDQRILLEEANVLKGNIGLGVTAAYAYNLDPGIGYNDNLFYDQKLRVGVGMDVLKNGYFSNRNKAQVKYNELEISRSQAPQDQKQLQRYLKWHNIIYQFNLKKIEVLKTREALAATRVDIASKLNHLKYVSQEDLITTISSHAEVTSMLQIYESYNEQLSSELSVQAETQTDYPLLDIDYSYSYKLMSMVEPDSITQLMIENLELQDKAVHDFRLRPYVAYNFFDLVSTNPDYRSYVSVGVTLAAPLNFNGGNKSNLREAKTQALLNPSTKNTEIQEDILSQFYEFRYKLKQFSSLYHKRRMYQELLRKEQVRRDISPLTFNPISALTTLDNIMKIDIELIDLKQQMYLKILNIYTDLPYSEANHLVKPITMNNDVKQEIALNHKNSIYIWSSSLKKYDSKVISHYIELNPFNRVTVSLNQNPEARTKLNTLIDVLNEKNVEVELMIGKNTLINGGFTDYMNTLGKGIDWSKISALHLDVEPHTNKDWHENKSSYLTKYHALLAEASTYCQAHNIALGVSIPTHYPEADIRKIFDVVDRVYFMCYENVKTDYIIRKTSIYPTEKTYIALRTNDFNNRLELENKAIELNTSMKVAGFVIHDFESLLQFDNSSINK
tara:strand:- start:16038 stop:18131 length:2094 start_codon:yes stop_codon:yes gene_type:complete